MFVSGSIISKSAIDLNKCLTHTSSSMLLNQSVPIFCINSRYPGLPFFMPKKTSAIRFIGSAKESLTNPSLSFKRFAIVVLPAPILPARPTFIGAVPLSSIITRLLSCVHHDWNRSFPSGSSWQTHFSPNPEETDPTAFEISNTNSKTTTWNQTHKADSRSIDAA